MLGGLNALALDMYVEPRNALAEEVQGLFYITLGIALFVFVVVMGLLIYMLVKFRRNTRVPRDETHRGHTTAEVVWTVIPAAILLFLGFLSAGTLIKLDDVPDDTDFAVHVEARQFAWIFIYPDENGTAFMDRPDPSVTRAAWCRENTARCVNVAGADAVADTDKQTDGLWVREGARVKLTVQGLDVIHAFAVPELSVKMDAVPGKINERWFAAPEVRETEEFFIQCMEYCGTGHHGMRAKLFVYPREGNDALWGRPG